MAIALLAQWGMYAHHRSVLHSPCDSRHAQPDVDAIASYRRRATPMLCMEMADLWERYPTLKRGTLLHAWIQAVEIIGDQRAVPTLMALADHQDPFIRQEATIALWTLHNQISMPTLIRLSKDPEPNIASVAQVALHQMSVQAKH